MTAEIMRVRWVNRWGLFEKCEQVGAGAECPGSMGSLRASGGQVVNGKSGKGPPKCSAGLGEVRSCWRQEERGRGGEGRGPGKNKKTTEAAGVTQSLGEYCTTNCLPNRISSQGGETFIQGGCPFREVTTACELQPAIQTM